MQGEAAAPPTEQIRRKKKSEVSKLSLPSPTLILQGEIES